VPETKYFFFPLLPVENENISHNPSWSVPELREEIAAIISNPKELHASVDGIEIPNLFTRRAVSPVFNVTLTNADNFLSYNYGRPVVGLIDPEVSDGYWLMLEPLPPGLHVLRYGGSFSNDLFYPSSIIANITVEPVPLAEWLSDFRVGIEQSSLSVRTQAPLLRKLRRAERFFEHNHPRSGITSLRHLERDLRRRVARNNSALADDFIRRAEFTIARAQRDLNTTTALSRSQ
jgi:hypothetical protein